MCPTFQHQKPTPWVFDVWVGLRLYSGRHSQPSIGQEPPQISSSQPSCVECQTYFKGILKTQYMDQDTVYQCISSGLFIKLSALARSLQVVQHVNHPLNLVSYNSLTPNLVRPIFATLFLLQATELIQRQRPLSDAETQPMLLRIENLCIGRG